MRVINRLYGWYIVHNLTRAFHEIFTQEISCVHNELLCQWNVTARHAYIPNYNKKLSRCWEYATCEPLEVVIVSAPYVVQNSTFFHPTLVTGITGYFDSGWLPHACSQDSDLWCVMCPSPLFVTLCDDNPATLQTDRQTSLLVAHTRYTAHVVLKCTLNKRRRKTVN